MRVPQSDLIFTMIVAYRFDNLRVTRKQMSEIGVDLARKNYNDYVFKGSNGWLYRFVRRYALSVSVFEGFAVRGFDGCADMTGARSSLKNTV